MEAERMLFVAAAVSLLPSCGMEPATEPAAFDPAVYEATARAVAPGVWLLEQPAGHEWHGNAALIEQQNGLVMVDAGSSAGDGQHLATLVQTLSDKPVEAVVLTHWHDDHSLGVSSIRDAWPNVRVIAAAGALEGMEGPMARRVGFEPDPALEAAREARFAPLIADFDAQTADTALDSVTRRAAAEEAAVLRHRLEGYRGSHLVRPTELVTDSLMLPDREAPVEVRFLGRGNSQGDLVISLPRHRLVFVGDLVIAPVPLGYGSYPAEWAATLRALDALEFDVLIPGHGEPMRDRLYLRQVLWSIEDIRRQVGTLAAIGLSADDVQGRMDYSEHHARWAPDDPTSWLEAITKAAYNEATGAPNLGGL